VITQPRRSVTRFFIPLIDVLILLFCIFLLMPFVSGPPAPEPDTKPAPQKEPLPENVTELQKQLTEARERLKRMEQAAQAGAAERLVVKALQIGKDKNGVFLYYYDPNRQEIRTEADALRLIAHQKTVASQAGGVKDVMFLVLYPLDDKGNPLGYPDDKEERTILGWFGGVKLKFQ
jgi:hypothetical protein